MATWCYRWRNHTDERIGRNIWKVGRKSEYNNQNQWKSKHAMHFQWWETYLGLHLEFSSRPSNFFNCGPPAHTNNFILLTPWWRKCKDGGGHLDCKKGLDMVSLSCFFPILSYSKASLSQHIFTGPHIFSFHSRIGHQENIKPFEWLSPYFYAVPTQLLVIASWILPNSIFSCLVSFKYFSDKFISDKVYLRLSPTCGIELGRAWILHSRALHLDTSPSHPPSLMTAFVYLPASVPVQSTSWLTWHVREMCLWRARAYGR